MLTPTVTYRLSLLLVILNTFGPTTLITLATSLLGIWNVTLLDTTSSPHREIQSASVAPLKSQAHVAMLAVVPLFAYRNILLRCCPAVHSAWRRCGAISWCGKCLRQGICLVLLS